MAYVSETSSIPNSFSVDITKYNIGMLISPKFRSMPDALVTFKHKDFGKKLISNHVDEERCARLEEYRLMLGSHINCFPPTR